MTHSECLFVAVQHRVKQICFIYHMLMKPLVFYDQIHLYAKNLEQEKYQNMMEKFNDDNQKPISRL